MSERAHEAAVRRAGWHGHFPEPAADRRTGEASGGRIDPALPAPVVKDSVEVEAHMGSVEIEFTAHNPGDWFFHCHIPMHMEGGMITLAKIA